MLSNLNSFSQLLRDHQSLVFKSTFFDFHQILFPGFQFNFYADNFIIAFLKQILYNLLAMEAEKDC